MLALALVGAMSLAACGGSGTESEATAKLDSQVQSIREAVDSGDHESALQRLNAMRSEALDMSRQNEISDRQFRQILAAALQVEARLPLAATPTDGDDLDPSEEALDPSEEAPDSQGQDGDPSSGRQGGSAGGSIGTPDGASGADGAPGQPGEDGEDGADGAAGITGRP